MKLPIRPPLKRWGTGLLAATLVTLLGACGSTAPATRWHQLPPDAPALPAATAGAQALPALQLSAVTLPEWLERDAIQVPVGRTGVQPLPGHRWAEPLREAVPRLLRQDLALWLGVPQVWAAPLPAGLVVQRQLRVELLQLQVDEARQQMRVQARWTLSDPSGNRPPQTRVESLVVPVPGSEVDALVLAHRLALWRLAEAVAGGVRAAAER